MELLKTFNNLFDLSYLDGKPKESERSIKQELEARCRSIAEEITDGLKNCDPESFNRWYEEDQPEDFQPHAWDYIEDMLDINYIHTRSCTVKGYWGSDQAQWGYVDNIGLDDVCEELYNCGVNRG
jgi:hypothetical protein